MIYLVLSLWIVGPLRTIAINVVVDEQPFAVTLLAELFQNLVDNRIQLFAPLLSAISVEF